MKIHPATLPLETYTQKVNTEPLSKVNEAIDQNKVEQSAKVSKFRQALKCIRTCALSGMAYGIGIGAGIGWIAGPIAGGITGGLLGATAGGIGAAPGAIIGIVAGTAAGVVGGAILGGAIGGIAGALRGLYNVARGRTDVKFDDDAAVVALSGLLLPPAMVIGACCAPIHSC